MGDVRITKEGMVYLERKVLEQFEENPILIDAREGRMSVEGALIQLADRKRPVRRMLPYGKDEAHNQQVEYLSELIGDQSHLIKNGIFALDNFAAGAVFVASSLACIVGLMTAAVYGQEVIQGRNAVEAITTTAEMCSVAFVPGLGALFHTMFTSKPNSKATQYLDSKISEHYHT